MNDFDLSTQDGAKDTPVTLSPSFDGFCTNDPMFREVFEIACPNEVFSDRVATGHEDSSEAAFLAL